MKKIMFVLIIIFGGLGLFSDTLIHSYKKNDILVVEVGIGHDELLEMDDCILQQHNVIWDVAGTYQAQYYDFQQETYVIRHIHVIHKQQVSSGISFSVDKAITNLSDVYIVRDVVYLSENSYYIVGSVDSLDEQIQTMFFQEYGFVQFYQNNHMTWEIIFDEGYSYVTSAALTSIGVICLMAFADGSGSKLKLVEITQNGNIARQTIYGGNGYAHAFEMVLFQQTLYIIATSNATNGDFTFSHSGQFIVFFSVRLLDLGIDYVKCYGNNQIARPIALTYDKDSNQFWLLMHLMGTMGEHKNHQGGYTGYFVLFIETFNKADAITPLNINGMGRGIFKFYNHIIVVFDGFFIQKEHLFFNYYSLSMQYQKQEQWILPDQSYFIASFKMDKTLFENTAMAINVTHKTTQQKSFAGVLIIDPLLTFYPHQGDYPVVNLTILDEDSIRLVKADGTFLQFYTLASEITAQKTIQYQLFIEESIYLNASPMGYIGVPHINHSIFGHYEELFIYQTSTSTIVVKNTYYITEKINIVNNQMYDVGVRLSFNGIGLLNDDEVDTHYVITTKGEYCLIVYGHSGERKIINFSVNDLSLGDILSTIKPIEIDDTRIQADALMQEPFAYATDFNIDTDGTSILWYVLLGLSAFIGIGWAMPIKRVTLK